MTYTRVELSPFSIRCLHGCGTWQTLDEAIAAARARLSHLQPWVGIQIWSGTPRNPIKCVQVIREVGHV